LPYVEHTSTWCRAGNAKCYYNIGGVNMTLMEMVNLFVAWMWKEICIIVPLLTLSLVTILVVMIVLKQIFGISTKKLVMKFLGGGF